MEDGIECLLKHIGDFYLNEKMSDITIIIKGVKLPAHRLFLVRYKYFQAMFESGMIEATSNRIELHETSIEGFKSVLKWIYTGTADITSIDDAFLVLRTAHLYEVTDLVDWMTDYFEDNFKDDNVCQILNEAILLSLGKLVDRAVAYVRYAPYDILEHDSFKQLSTESLNVMLTRGVHEASNGAIFRAVMGWMKANPNKTAEFCDILKNVPLSSVTIEDLAKIPANLLDMRTIIDLIAQQETSGPVYCLRDENVALPKYGFKVIAGRDTSVFEKDEAVLKHKIGSENGIVIDLGRRFMLNSFEMKLFEADVRRTYSYWIAVSEDNVKWTRVIDHSKYPCRSLQNLYFDARPVRFIRISGTASTTAFFQISILRAFYTTKTFEIDRETTLVMPPENVALPAKNAIVSQGFSFPATLFGTGIIIQLPQPYLLDSVRVLLCDEQLPVYCYELEVSTDGLVWNHIISEENVALWRDINFDMQAVVFVKITGIHDSANIILHCLNLQCFANVKNDAVPMSF